MALKISLKRPDQEKSTLLIRFSKNGTPFKFYTGKTIISKHWDGEEQKVSSKAENYKLINRYLENFVYELGVIIDRYDAQKLRLNQDAINEELDKIFNRQIINTKKVDVFDFIAFYDTFIDNRQHYAKPTKTILKQNRKHVICAMGLVSKSELTKYNSLTTKKRGTMELIPSIKLPFEQIDKAFFEKFIKYLHTATFTKKIRGVEVQLNYKKNYITKHIKRLRQVVDDAMEDGLVKPFSMKKFKTEDEDVDSIYTDIDALQAFVDLNLFGMEKLACDKYVLNCFLGMRFSDLNGQLEKHMFQEKVIEGVKHVIYIGRQIKTDNRVEFPLHRNAVAILEKYDYNMPKISEGYFNRVIKEIAKRAGLTALFRKRETRGSNETLYNDIPSYELISSHTGRRSFCTIYYSAGWPIQAIMAISGHKTEEEFLKYVKAGVKIEVLVSHLSKIPDLRIENRMKVA